MVIVCTSIPLAIFTSIIGLNLGGHSINISGLTSGWMLAILERGLGGRARELIRQPPG
jgi:hypothetical protein